MVIFNSYVKLPEGTEPGDHVSQCRPKKGNRWWKGAWNAVAVTWSDLTKSDGHGKYHVLNQKTSAQWDDAWKSVHRRKHVLYCFMPNFMMFYEGQNMSKPVFRSGYQETNLQWQIAVRASSRSLGIPQEETNGDALSLLSFSQRSIGFVALTHSYPTHFVLESFPSKFMSQVVN